MSATPTSPLAASPTAVAPGFTRGQRWTLALVCLLAFVARSLPGERIIDDSYITYRYARNLLAGEGIVYNPGEQVLGTTTPLYTSLLASLALFTGGTKAPFSSLAVLLNTQADLLTCALLVWLGQRLGLRYAGWGAALTWAIAPFSVTFAIGGLETSVYVLLLTGMVAAYLDEKVTLAAGLGALAYLTRPDALILVAPLALETLVRLWRNRQALAPADWRQAGLAILVFLLPVLAWTIFATVYYGSPLPHSIAAKSLAYRISPGASFIRLLQHYNTPFLDHLTFGNAWIGVGLFLYPFLYLVGARYLGRQSPRLWPYLLYPYLYLATFALANPLIFRWYLTPPLPGYFLGILAGLELLATPAASRLRRADDRRPLPRLGPGRSALLAGLVILAPLALTLRGWVLQPDHGPATPAPDMAWFKLELLYRQAADSLAPEMARWPQPPVLAAGDVGVLGFFTPARILDTVGLNSPVSTTYYPLDERYYAGNYAISPELILDQQPDYIVILEVYGRNGLLQDPRFWQAYRLRQKIPTDIYGSDGMLILERQQ